MLLMQCVPLDVTYVQRKFWKGFFDSIGGFMYGISRDEGTEEVCRITIL